MVLECAGFLPATPEGLQYLRRSGTFVEVGHFVDMGSLDFNINQLLMRKNLTLEAVWGTRYEHFVRAMPILEKQEFPVRRPGEPHPAAGRGEERLPGPQRRLPPRRRDRDQDRGPGQRELTQRYRKPAWTLLGGVR